MPITKPEQIQAFIEEVNLELEQDGDSRRLSETVTLPHYHTLWEQAGEEENGVTVVKVGPLLFGGAGHVFHVVFVVSVGYEMSGVFHIYGTVTQARLATIEWEGGA